MNSTEQSTAQGPLAADHVEAHLIARFQAGDSEAFTLLVNRFGIDLAAYVSCNCPRGLAHEDVTQHVWMQVWKHREEFKPHFFRAWLYRIAKNFIINHYRKKREEFLSEEVDPAARELDPEDPRLDALRDCLDSLDGPFIEVIRLQQQAASTKEIAVQLSISDGTVGSRGNRGKQLLRECVERKMQ